MGGRFTHHREAFEDVQVHRHSREKKIIHVSKICLIGILIHCIYLIHICIAWSSMFTTVLLYLSSIYWTLYEHIYIYIRIYICRYIDIYSCTCTFTIRPYLCSNHFLQHFMSNPAMMTLSPPTFSCHPGQLLGLPALWFEQRTTQKGRCRSVSCPGCYAGVPTHKLACVFRAEGCVFDGGCWRCWRWKKSWLISMFFRWMMGGIDDYCNRFFWDQGILPRMYPKEMDRMSMGVFRPLFNWCVFDAFLTFREAPKNSNRHLSQNDGSYCNILFLRLDDW